MFLSLVLPLSLNVLQVLLAGFALWRMSTNVTLKDYRRRYWWLLALAIVSGIVVVNAPGGLTILIQLIVVFLAGSMMGKAPYSHYLFLDRVLILILLLAVAISWLLIS